MVFRGFITLLMTAALSTGCDSAGVKELDQCPRNPHANEADFLPLEGGETWTFNYRRTAFSMLTPRSRVEENGVLELEILGSTCRDGVRSVDGVERRLGIMTRTTENWFTGVPDIDSVAVDTTLTRTIIEDTSGVHLPWLSRPIDRYHSAAIDSVAVTTETATDCVWLAVANLARSQGLVRIEARIAKVSGGCSFVLARTGS